MTLVPDKLTTEDGEEIEIYVEVDDDEIEGDFEDELRGVDVRGAFKRAMEAVRACAEEVGNTIKRVKDEVKPTAYEVQFSIKLSKEAGIPVLVKGTAEGVLQVTLKWEKQV